MPARNKVLPVFLHIREPQLIDNDNAFASVFCEYLKKLRVTTYESFGFEHAFHILFGWVTFQGVAKTSRKDRREICIVLPVQITDQIFEIAAVLFVF